MLDHHGNICKTFPQVWDYKIIWNVFVFCFSPTKLNWTFRDTNGMFTSSAVKHFRLISFRLTWNLLTINNINVFPKQTSTRTEIHVLKQQNPEMLLIENLLGRLGNQEENIIFPQSQVFFLMNKISRNAQYIWINIVSDDVSCFLTNN